MPTNDHAQPWFDETFVAIMNISYDLNTEENREECRVFMHAYNLLPTNDHAPTLDDFHTRPATADEPAPDYTEPASLPIDMHEDDISKLVSSGVDSLELYLGKPIDEH